MELSQFTDYSLRVLIYVGMTERGNRSKIAAAQGACEPTTGLPSVREIAAAFRISQSHLVKVVHRLAQLGYIHTYRGRGGGIALAKDPDEIAVGTVVRQTENLAIVECLSGSQSEGGGCCIAPACELKRVLARAREAFLTSLDGSTISDLLKPHSTLLQLLRPGQSSPANATP